jgi:molybdopterin synthase catalytic subunit
VTESPLDIEEHARVVEHPAAGAVVTFTGVVRNHDGGKEVTALDYSAHPQAETVIREVAQQIAAAADGVRGIAVSHRIGSLRIGDVALACAVAAEHRAQAFAVCATLVDEVKARLPVWKHQHFADDTEEWVNCP